MNGDKIDEAKELRQAEDLAQTAAGIVRRESGAGLLIQATEILQRLDEQDNPHQAVDFESLRKKILDENEDIRELAAGEGSLYYFSTRFMTGAYAAVLLKKRGDPLMLIADIVRQNTAAYLRPVPLDLFMQSPFDFAHRDLLKMLEQMETLEAFIDIARTTTSASREFLYSTRFLEPAHASLMAQWIDVGQSENP
jgi:hypothetical protein